MKKNGIYTSIFILGLLVLLNFQPTIVSQTNDEAYRQITTTYHGLTNRYTKTLSIPQEHIDRITYLLSDLSQALISKDLPQITDLLTQLESYGLSLTIHDILPNKEDISRHHFKQTQSEPITTSIDNTLCYTHITGRGTLFFTIATLLFIPTLLLIQMFGEEILSVLIPIYLLIYGLTHLIPFRFLLPIGQIILNEGSVSTIGLNGQQSMETNYSDIQMTIGGFTGVTINIPGNNTGFLFVSGLSLIARSSD